MRKGSWEKKAGEGVLKNKGGKEADGKGRRKKQSVSKGVKQEGGHRGCELKENLGRSNKTVEYHLVNQRDAATAV